MPDGSNNPFYCTDAPTFASLIDLIMADAHLLDRQRQDLCSALRCMARWLDVPPERLPANLGYVRRRLERFEPTAAGVAQRRFENIRSLVMKAFRHAGLDAMKASYLCPMTPSWQSLHDKLSTSYQRWGVSRFMRFCSNQAIEPDTVDQEVFDRFGIALAEESLVKRPREDHQTACRLWNKMREHVPGWPTFEVEVPRSNRSYAVEWTDCHQSLFSEVRAYLNHLAGTDLLAPRPLLRPMSKRSIDTVEGNLKRFLGALRGAGEDIQAIRTLQDLVALDRVERGLRWLWERKGRKLDNSIGDITWTLRCISVKHLEADDDTASRFAEIVERTRTVRKGLSAKNRALLERFDDRRNVSAFVRLPQALWFEAHHEAAAGRRHKAALMVQDAVLVEILQFAPMRLTNLACLDLDRHVSWFEGKNGMEAQIIIPGEEVKNGERLTYLLPTATTQHLRTYIEEWRTMDGSLRTNAVFPGASDGHKDTSSLRKQISRATRRHLGFAISPHQFRHVAAKLLLDARPGAYEVVRKVLGHRSVSTTYEHYAGEETKAASEFYNNAVLGYGEDVPERPKGRRLRTTKARVPSSTKPVRKPVEPVRRTSGKRKGTWKP